MEEILIVANVALFGWLASMVARIMNFSMQFNHILFQFRLWLTRKLTKRNLLKGTENLTFEEVTERVDDNLLEACRESRILTLSACVYCLSIWTGILASLWYGIDCGYSGLLFHVSIPIASFFITDKL